MAWRSEQQPRRRDLRNAYGDADDAGRDHRDFFYEGDEAEYGHGSGRRLQDHGERERRRDYGQFGRHYSGYGEDAYRTPIYGGPYRGKGPRGYVRSDERIREEICDCLTIDSYVDASDIEIAVKGGEVHLDGWVRDRDAKRRAEDIAENCSGVRHVQNNLRVKPEGEGLDDESKKTGGRGRLAGRH
ncbi:MAG TPA: BON domain-containing protein [Reyranellaceae bacterium]|nr:BON domain-containing protein [Reyranellaceae bacterium]